MEALETGQVAFVYHPAVEEEDPAGLVDVQNFAVLLQPRDTSLVRRIVVGRKRLPDIDETERVWGFVDRVTDDPEQIRAELGAEDYTTATRGRRHQPAARLAGAGGYAIARRGRDTYLAYRLRLPTDPADVQRELDIPEEGRFVLSVKNPEISSPPEAGLPASLDETDADELTEMLTADDEVPATPLFTGEWH